MYRYRVSKNDIPLRIILEEEASSSIFYYSNIRPEMPNIAAISNKRRPEREP
jgi:hypothetical protein